MAQTTHGFCTRYVKVARNVCVSDASVTVEHVSPVKTTMFPGCLASGLQHPKLSLEHGVCLLGKGFHIELQRVARVRVSIELAQGR